MAQVALDDAKQSRISHHEGMNRKSPEVSLSAVDQVTRLVDFACEITCNI